MTKISPTLRAILGIIALLVIVISASWLTRLTVFGNSGIDLTEHKIHTLTDGTRKILEELDSATPVTVRFYATRESPLLSREQKLFIGKVDALLKKYESLAGGSLNVEYLDPQPDTEEEDSARLDGIQGQRVTLDNQEENLYLGIAVTCLDQKAQVASLSPSKETMLEYELSKSIAEVSRIDKPLVGLISGLPLKSNPAAMRGQRPQEPWIIYQALAKSFEIKDLGSSPEKIDSKITSLLVLHPQNISKETEYAIDQYLLQGGTVIACLDPHCYAANSGFGGTSSSDLPNLLKAWKVSYDSSKVLFDHKYRTALQGGITSPVFLSLNRDSIVNEKEIVTEGLNDLVMVMTGSFRGGSKDLEVERLISSSKQSGLMDSIEAADIRGSARRVLNQPTDGGVHTLAMRLKGNFKTAFPDGNPKNGEKKTEDKEDEKDISSEEADPEMAKKEISAENDGEKEIHLKESSGKGSVILIADADFIANPFSYRMSNIMGMQMVEPVNGNSSLFLNIVDQTLGSKHLIGARGRVSTRRPFTVVEEMESEFERNVGEKIAEIELKQSQTISKIRQLESQRTESGSFSLSKDSAKEIEKLNAEQVSYAKEIRTMQKGLKSQKSSLAGKMIQVTIIPIISLVVLTGVVVWSIRKRRSAAKV